VAGTRLLLPTLAIVLTACQATPDPAEPTLAEPTATLVASDQPSGGQAGDPAPQGSAPASGQGSAQGALAAWQTHDLVDVRSGERFAIADLAGRAVVIEPMAIWCTNCARQQQEASKALARLGSSDVVYISLDVDPAERAPDLARYADERGFDWRFVVAERALSRALAQAFGDQVLAPPSTPKILIAPDGQVSGPEFGIQDASTVEAELRDLLS
jgi:hypothetical protein